MDLFERDNYLFEWAFKEFYVRFLKQLFGVGVILIGYNGSGCYSIATIPTFDSSKEG